MKMLAMCWGVGLGVKYLLTSVAGRKRSARVRRGGQIAKYCQLLLLIN